MFPADCSFQINLAPWAPAAGPEGGRRRGQIQARRGARSARPPRGNPSGGPSGHDPHMGQSGITNKKILSD